MCVKGGAQKVLLAFYRFYTSKYTRHADYFISIFYFPPVACSRAAYKTAMNAPKTMRPVHGEPFFELALPPATLLLPKPTPGAPLPSV